jgi:hypothetical protein
MQVAQTFRSHQACLSLTPLPWSMVKSPPLQAPPLFQFPSARAQLWLQFTHTHTPADPPSRTLPHTINQRLQGSRRRRAGLDATEGCRRRGWCSQSRQRQAKRRASPSSPHQRRQAGVQGAASSGEPAVKERKKRREEEEVRGGKRKG